MIEFARGGMLNLIREMVPYMQRIAQERSYAVILSATCWKELHTGLHPLVCVSSARCPAW